MKRYAKPHTKTVHGPVHNRSARGKTRLKRTIKRITNHPYSKWLLNLTDEEVEQLSSEREPFIDDPYAGDDDLGLEGW